MKYVFLLFIILSIVSCSEQPVVSIKNVRKGKLDGSYYLDQTGEKEFLLDSATAPKIPYIQFIEDDKSKKTLCLLNKYNSCLYFYDFKSKVLLNKLQFKTEGPDKVLMPEAFFFKNDDSVYFFNPSSLKLLQVNNKLKIVNKISLIKNNNIKKDPWTFKYPQYNPQNSNPMVLSGNDLLFPGQFMNTIPKSILSNFRIITRINLNNLQTSYIGKYPDALYGSNFNWEGGIFTEAFTSIEPKKNRIVISFPISHDLYVKNLSDTNSYKKIYGGSNYASTITSIPEFPKKTTRDILTKQVLNNDQYGAIIFDEFRRVYYRFIMRKNKDSNASYTDKEVGIIILDENLKYLGESNIGKLKNWHTKNAFVTDEGLYIEYIPESLDESLLIFKVLKLQK